MEYEKAIQNATQFLAITSLTVEQFEYLLKHFRPKCDKFFRYKTLDGKTRKHPTDKEHQHSKLRGSGNKLFFLLVLLKTNSLQELHGFTFGVSQSKVSRVKDLLLRILNETLESMGLSPHRDSETLAPILEKRKSEYYAYDGIERGIQRNMDNDVQEDDFSGKKKDTW